MENTLPHAALYRLAAEGMRFTDYYSGSAVCAPARCTLMTGLHGGHAYIRNNSEVGSWDSFEGQLPLPAGTVTIATLLKRRGYVTGAFGKWGLTGAHYAPQRIADELLAFIRQNRDRPFFAYYPTVIPHLALQVPEADLAQYKGRWPETPYAGNSYLPHPMPRACYAAMISFLDRKVGRVMELLKQEGLDRNTVVFFTSDNGTTTLKAQVDHAFFESVGPLRGLKGSLHEGGIRAPMITRWPDRIRPGSVSHHPGAHYDVLATLAEIAGGESPSDTDGVSLLPVLLSKPDEQKRREYLFWDFAGYGGQLAVRMGRWKGVKQGLVKNPDAPLELYDLETDVSERKNVAAEHPEIAARIERIMVEARTPPAVEMFRFGRYGP